jgi:hypothetical protein
MKGAVQLPRSVYAVHLLIAGAENLSESPDKASQHQFDYLASP